MRRNMLAVASAVAGLCMLALPARAETQLSVFGGANWNLSSDVGLRNAPDVPNESRSMDWDGDSFEMPPYWGVRGTYWLGAARSWGLAVDFAHTKAVADLNGAAGDTYDRLEFTDGSNLLLLDVLYRFSPMLRGTLLPYVGAGVGAAIPHVEVTLAKTGSRTFEYQLAGPAAQVLAGLEYKLNEQWSLFSEARLSYAHISADLEGGGSLETDLWSPQVAVGVSYRFPGL